jgi:hypothetical protein
MVPRRRCLDRFHCITYNGPNEALFRQVSMYHLELFLRLEEVLIVRPLVLV